MVTDNLVDRLRNGGEHLSARKFRYIGTKDHIEAADLIIALQSQVKALEEAKAGFNAIIRHSNARGPFWWHVSRMVEIAEDCLKDIKRVQTIRSETEEEKGDV